MDHFYLGNDERKSDHIRVTGLKVFAYHGVYPEEQARGQEFVLNLKLFYDMCKAGQTDHLEEAINYAECCEYICKVFTEKPYALIEAAAEHVCKRLLLHFSKLERVELEVCKPHAPMELTFENVSVCITRGWHRAYLSIGSNVGDRRNYLNCALQALEEYEEIMDLRVSDIFETEPYGPVAQDNFYNACVELRTLFDPERMLEVLHEIEHKANRKRDIHWGPRTLDMDLIFYDKLVYESDTLMIPHVDMEHRDFVLKPLSQLCPHYRHPLLGRTVMQLWMEWTKEHDITCNEAP